MGRTLRSKKLRWLLWQAADGKCQICGCDLPNDWHADHIVPFIESGRTNVHEMQALCPDCNLKKGSTSMEFRFDKEKLRPGQVQALDAIFSRVGAGEKTTAVVLPTRYGKSDLIRLAALAMQHNGLCCQSLVLSPSGDLANQIVRKDKLQDMQSRYGLNWAQVKKCHRVKGHEYNPGANGEYLLSTTTQLVQRNVDEFASLADTRIVASGLPFVLYVDETQNLSETNKWGDIATKFLEVGSHVVLLTATPIRQDGGRIPGFEFDVLSEKPTQYTNWKEHPNRNDKAILDIYAGVRKEVRLIADHETTFKEAWNEDPSPMCLVTRDMIDIELTRLEGFKEVEGKVKLSELTPSQARAQIGKICRDPYTIEAGVRRLLRELKAVREVYPDMGAIVFTGADHQSDKEINKHAQEVLEKIEIVSEELGVEFDCVIATSSGGEKPSRKLEKFATNVNGGGGDILIVKNAGGAGFDCTRLKIELDLSPTRTIAACMQRWFRIATPMTIKIDGINVSVCTLITLADCLTSNIFIEGIANEGGAFQVEAELVETIEIDRKERPKSPLVFSVESAQVGAFDDSDGNQGNIEIYADVDNLLAAFPIIGTQHSKPEIADKLSSRSLSFIGTLKTGETEDDEIHRLQASAKKKVKEIVNHKMLGRYDPKQYGKECSEFWGVIFSKSGLEKSSGIHSVDKISDLQLLKTINQVINVYADAEETISPN